MGISFQETRVIQHPIEGVFAFISNMENSPLWGRTIETTKVSDGPISVGTKFREEVKLMGRRKTILTEVTGYDLPARFSHAGRVGDFRERASYTFEPEGEVTRVTWAGEAQMGGLGELLAPIFSRMLCRNVQARFKSLKAALEAPGGRSIGPITEGLNTP